MLSPKDTKLAPSGTTKGVNGPVDVLELVDEDVLLLLLLLVLLDVEDDEVLLLLDVDEDVELDVEEEDVDDVEDTGTQLPQAK